MPLYLPPSPHRKPGLSFEIGVQGGFKVVGTEQIGCLLAKTFVDFYHKQTAGNKMIIRYFGNPAVKNQRVVGGDQLKEKIG